MKEVSRGGGRCDEPPAIDSGEAGSRQTPEEVAGLYKATVHVPNILYVNYICCHLRNMSPSRVAFCRGR